MFIISCISVVDSPSSKKTGAFIPDKLLNKFDISKHALACCDLDSFLYSLPS